MNVTDSVLVLAGFLLGSFPSAYVLTRLWSGRDIRTLGSLNVGATNVYRCVGALPGAVTLVLDMAKGALAVLLASSLGSGNEWLPAAAAVSAVLGHAYTPWLLFRGGKGVATAAGAYLVLAPVALVLAVPLFVGGSVLSRRISVGSLAAAGGFPVLAWLTGYGKEIYAPAILLTVLIFWLHGSNIVRLVRGEEPPTGGAGESGLDQDT